MSETSLFIEFTAAPPIEFPAGLEISSLTSRGITGELITTGVIVAVTGATIKALRDVLIALINRNQECSIIWKGRHVKAASPADVHLLIEAINKDIKDA